MKQSTVLNVSAEALFAIMKNSLIRETGQNDPQICTGYSWSKKTGNRRTRIKITAWKEPEVYAARFTTDGKELNIRYDLEPLDTDRVRVTYTHDLGEPGFLGRRREKAAAKKAISVLKAVEKAMLAKKDPD